ncbi:GNAT family N-acetyltransferase [Pseudaeromonas sp. ZJS20]|uniref:GNAT family N-acetyltransferase n=1 Tax=Pseudaeromonas aegiceratis TaxID=3153928 RepID=UPI00390C40C0
MTGLQIRPATQADLAAVQACARAAFSRYIPRMEKLPGPMCYDYGAKLAAGCLYVACYQGQFAGYLVYYPQGDGLHLETIALLPALAGRGLGRALIGHVEQAARTGGYAQVLVNTNEAMTENLAMYPRLGYQEYDRRLDEGYHRVFFRKPIN